MTQADAWSWFDAPELNDVDLSGHDVTAVLVCRNAASWLNAALAGLGGLDRRPDVIVAVDNESTDDTPDLLEDARQAGLIDAVVTGKASYSFGEAVERALTTRTQPTRWVWLLHDDAVPDHDALTELLTLAARTPRLAIAVPLLVRPSRRSHAARTLEIGATISGSGGRALGLEPDEVAQGQYESTSVLGGSTCGMLVNWEALRAIGGFDPCILGYRDGVDLGWRAQLAGQWVLTCPTARIVHRQVGRSEIRQRTLASQANRSEAAWDRLMGLRLVAAHAHGLGKLLMLARLTLVCLITAFVYLLGRAPDRARDEVQAWADFLFRSRKPVARLRKKIAGVAQRGRDTRYRIRSLRPTLGGVVEDGFQSLTRWFHDQFVPNRDSDMTLDDLLGDEYTRRIGEGRGHVPVGVWLVLVLGGLALMARHLFTTGLVTASGLLGAPSSLGQAFELALSGAGRSQPWLLLSAAASALTVRPAWFPVVLLIVSFPLTMLLGVWFARHRIQHTALRWLTAAGYALLPVLMGGVNRGALWLVAAAAVLPFVAEWLSRLGRPWTGARSLQGLAGLALSGVVVIALLPAAWLPVAVVALVVVVRAGGAARIVRTAVAVILPVLFWAQAIPSWIREPARLIATPEAMLNSAPLTWQMLLARPTAVGLPPFWLSVAVTGVLWLGAVILIFRGSWHRLMVVAGLASIGVGMWLGHLPLALGRDSVYTDASIWLLVGFALLLFALVSWIDATLGSLEGQDFGLEQALVGFLSLILVAAFLLSAGWSAYAGMQQVHRGASQRVPEYLAQNELKFDTATLIVDAGSATWNLRAQGQTLWGQGSYRDGALSSEPATTVLEQIVARAVAGRPDDTVTDQLATFGVSAVVIFNPSPETVAALDATAGLQRSTADEAVQIWSVTQASADQSTLTPTRRALVTPGSPPLYLGATDQVAPDSPRTLVLALPPDPDRHVLVGGVETQPVSSGDWRAAYALGEASGAVTIERVIDQPWAPWVQLGVFLVFIVFVFPPLGEENTESPRYQMRGAR